MAQPPFSAMLLVSGGGGGRIGSIVVLSPRPAPTRPSNPTNSYADSYPWPLVATARPSFQWPKFDPGYSANTASRTHSEQFCIDSGIELVNASQHFPIICIIIANEMFPMFSSFILSTTNLPAILCLNLLKRLCLRVVPLLAQHYLTIAIDYNLILHHTFQALNGTCNQNKMYVYVYWTFFVEVHWLIDIDRIWSIAHRFQEMRWIAFKQKQSNFMHCL